MKLSPEQQRAIERRGQDVCVVAGPGSGKTRVLIERFAWLVEQRGIDAERILAITFTDKAATEIKQRLIERFSENARHREAIERAWVSTIHGFCARLLRENAIVAGLSPDFSVLEQVPADRMAREAAEEALDDLFAGQPNEMRRLLEALDLSTQDDGRKPDLAASLLEVYEVMRVSGVHDLPVPKQMPDKWPEAQQLAREILEDTGKGGTETPQLREWCKKFLALPNSLTREHFEVAGGLKAHMGRVGRGAAQIAGKTLKDEILPALAAQWIEAWNAGLPDLLREAIKRLDSAYREKKRAQSVLDFSDLEEEAIRLLESSAPIRQETRVRFDQILMDELQDTNRLQWRLLSLIRSPEKFFAVGDINQSIYGFRHAEPAVFEEFRRGLEASGATIDDLRENHRSRQEILEAVSSTLDAQSGIEPRPLKAAKEFPRIVGPLVERIVAQSDAELEAAIVAERIRTLVSSEDCEYKNIAILVRSLSSLEPFERALDKSGIPFLTTGGRTFLESREIRDLLMLLAALVNPLDEIALVGVLRSPLVGMRDEAIFRASKEEWRELFRARFGKLREQAGFLAPDRLLASALDESNYLANITSRARANIDKLLSWLRREHRDRPRPLAELLDDLEALRATQSEAEAPPPEAGDVVRLMSIHAAKGLEFGIVFISAIHRGPDRRKPVIAFSQSAGLGIKWRNPATGEGQEDTAYAVLMEDLKRREEAEENRLLYVAMTRAEHRLFLSYASGSRRSPWQKLAEAGIPMETSASVTPLLPSASNQETTGNTEKILMPPHVSAQYDSSTSVTSVVLFEACPRKYFLNHYLALDQENEPEKLGTGALSLGLEVHRVLAGLASESSEAAVLAEKFRSSELGARSARASRVEHEFDFLLAIGDVVLRGQIDLWFEENNELILVDYKTDREESPEAYALQLRLYALALEHYAGRLPDHAVLYYLRSDRPMEISLGKDELEGAKDTVRNLLEAQERMEFPLREGDHCRRCSFYRGLCPAGKTPAGTA